MSLEAYHVIPNPDGGWNVKKGGSTRASKHFSTKEEAVSWARELSARKEFEFVIHKEDGTVERKESA